MHQNPSRLLSLNGVDRGIKEHLLGSPTGLSLDFGMLGDFLVPIGGIVGEVARADADEKTLGMMMAGIAPDNAPDNVSNSKTGQAS